MRVDGCPHRLHDRGGNLHAGERRADVRLREDRRPGRVLHRGAQLCDRHRRRADVAAARQLLHARAPVHGQGVGHPLGQRPVDGAVAGDAEGVDEVADGQRVEGGLDAGVGHRELVRDFEGGHPGGGGKHAHHHPLGETEVKLGSAARSFDRLHRHLLAAGDRRRRVDVIENRVDDPGAETSPVGGIGLMPFPAPADPIGHRRKDGRLADHDLDQVGFGRRNADRDAGQVALVLERRPGTFPSHQTAAFPGLADRAVVGQAHVLLALEAAPDELGQVAIDVLADHRRQRQGTVVDVGPVLDLANGARRRRQRPHDTGVARAEGDRVQEHDVLFAPPRAALDAFGIDVRARPTLGGSAAAIRATGVAGLLGAAGRHPVDGRAEQVAKCVSGLRRGSVGGRGRRPVDVGAHGVEERACELFAGLESLLGVFGHRLRHDREDVVRDRGRRPRLRKDLGMEHARHGPGEWRLPVQQLVEHAAEGIDVGALIDGVALDLLRRHVGGCPDHGSGGRQTAHLADHLGDAEVEDLGLALGGDEHVVGLQVAVHDAAAVCRTNRRQQLLDQVERDVHSEPAAVVEPVAQRAAFDVLHDDEKRVALGVEVVDADDAGMVESRHRGRFTLETGTEVLVLGVALGQHLDGHGKAQTRVHSRVHDAHGAAAQL